MPQPSTFTVARSTYALFGVLFGIVAAIGIAASVASTHWQPAVFCSLPLLFAMAWLSRYRLEIGDTYVAYRSWTHSSRLDVADVSEVAFAGMPLHDPEIPLSICVLRSRDGGTMSVNLKVFPREAALRLVHLASGARPQAAARR
jgi:hypothetical protein